MQPNTAALRDPFPNKTDPFSWSREMAGPPTAASFFGSDKAAQTATQRTSDSWPTVKVKWMPPDHRQAGIAILIM
jgi:hypothetical protein